MGGEGEKEERKGMRSCALTEVFKSQCQYIFRGQGQGHGELASRLVEVKQSPG